MSSACIPICVNESPPAGIVISALEVIQPGLYGAYLAARAKLGKKKMGEIGDYRGLFLTALERGNSLQGFGFDKAKETKAFFAFANGGNCYM